MDPQVRVRGLRKRYGQVDAVADVSFDVRPDEILGILGPNGAGKTTTLEIIEGLRRPDHGEVVVAGVDVRRNPRRAKARIGVQAGSMRNSAPATAPRPWCGRSGHGLIQE